MTTRAPPLVLLQSVAVATALQLRPLSHSTPLFPRAGLRATLAPSVYADTAAAIGDLWTLDCLQEGCAISPQPDDAVATPLGTKVSSDSTVTVLWTQHDWERHMSSDRYFRHLLNWYRSTILRSLAPMLAFLTAWTLAAWWQQWKLTSVSLGWLSSPLALLLAFRVNAAVARFNEARILWGRAVYCARDLASTLAAAPEVPDATRALCCRLLASFGWAAKAALRAEPANEVFETLLPGNAAASVSAARKPPLKLLSLMRRATLPLPLPQATALTVQQQISELNLWCAAESEQSSNCQISARNHSSVPAPVPGTATVEWSASSRRRCPQPICATSREGWWRGS